MIAAETLAMLNPRPPLPDPSVTDDHGRPITRLRRDGPPEAGVWRCFVGAEFVGRIAASTEAIWRCGLWPALGRDDLLAALARLGRAWGKQRAEAAIYATWSDEDLVAEIWRRLPPMSTGGVFNPTHTAPEIVSETELERLGRKSFGGLLTQVSRRVAAEVDSRALFDRGPLLFDHEGDLQVVDGCEEIRCRVADSMERQEREHMQRRIAEGGWPPGGAGLDWYAVFGGRR